MSKANESAFPQTTTTYIGEGIGDLTETLPGLTKRELIAAMCLQGLLSNSTFEGTRNQYLVDCVAYADALLAELSKERP